MVSPGVKETDAIGLAEFVMRTSPTTAVVMVRERGIMNGLLPEAMRAGIRDVVDLSRGSNELRDALQRAVAWSAQIRTAGAGAIETAIPTKRGTIVSVFSSKGGTGKTFLATNLAAALADRSGEDTALVDLELELGDVFAYFGEESRQTLHDLLAIGDMTEPDDIRTAGRQLGNHLLAFGAPSEPGTQGISGEAIGKVLRSIRSTFSFTVVDAGAGYSDAALAAFDLSDSVFLITGLDIVGLKHLSLALRTLMTLDLPRDRFRIVLNRSDSKVGLDPAEVERVMKIQVDARIPSSRLVPLSLNKGAPVYRSEPKSDVARSIGTLADRIIASSRESHGKDDEAKHRRPGLFRR